MDIMAMVDGLLGVFLGHGALGVLTVVVVAESYLIFWMLKRYIGLIERSVESHAKVATMLEGLRSGGHTP